jgi:oligosaccharide repeat unit polymerase
MVVFLVLFTLMAVVLNKKPEFDALWACDPTSSKATSSTTTIVSKTIPSNTSSQITPKITRLDQFKWNIQVYLLGGLAAFNYHIKTGEPHIDGGAILPNAIRKMLNLVGANLPMRPALNPAVLMPLKSNVFTAIFPVYHDLGKLGVGIWFFLLGMMHQFLFKLSQSTQLPIFRYFYAISLYPLVMIIFEEAYISSPGFWAIFILTPALLQALNAYFQNSPLNKLGKA